MSFSSPTTSRKGTFLPIYDNVYAFQIPVHKNKKKLMISHKYFRCEVGRNLRVISLNVIILKASKDKLSLTYPSTLCLYISKAVSIFITISTEYQRWLFS